MKLATHLFALLALASFSSRGQVFAMSGAYSPTFESYNIGFGFGDKDLIMDYQFGFSDEFFSMGMDMQFGLTDDILLRSSNLSVIYLGFGGEMYLMDDSEKDLGYALYGLASISFNQFVFSYGYGFYDYDGIPASGLDGYHKLMLTIIFAEIE